VSSLSERERVGLDDVFLCLGEKPGFSDTLIEHKKRLFTSLSQIVIKGLPITINYIKFKSKSSFKNNFMPKGGSKRDNFKLFNHFRPKNRDSK